VPASGNRSNSAREHRPRVAIVPATFDPPTNGHLEVIARSARIFDEVVVAVYQTPNKQTLFSAEERLDLMRAAVREAHLANVRVRPFDGLTVDMAREEGAVALVKGLRAVSDFDYEFQMSHMNGQLAPEIETVAILASAEYSFLSSTLVREVAKLGGDVSRWVSRVVADRLRQKYGKPSGMAAVPSALEAEGGADRMGGFVAQDERVR
jgi:pantetheine-phosphate adenylyltransferase